MNIELKIDLTNNKEVYETLELIKKCKTTNEQEKVLSLITEYRILSKRLHEIGKELDNLALILKELDVYCSKHGSFMECDCIRYSVLGNGKLTFSLTFGYHYMSLQYLIADKEWVFSNIELGANNDLEVLEYKIKLMKAFISDYPSFIKNMEKEINYKLKKLMED